MKGTLLGKALLVAGGALALWGSTCFFAAPPRGNPPRQGERQALVPGARWEFDLSAWNAGEGVPMLALVSDAQEMARVEVRIERAGVEPQAQTFELEGEYMITAVPPARTALELTAYDGPPTQGRVDVRNDDLDRYVTWSITRSGGMFGLLIGALCAGAGLLLVWRRPSGARRAGE